MESKKLKCPKCHSQDYVKNGKSYGKQRYRCKSCQYNFTTQRLVKGIDSYYVRLSLRLCLEGMSFRSIERIVGVRHVSVINWVKKYGRELKTLRDISERSELKAVKIDKLHSYIGSKKLPMPPDCFGQSG